MRFTQNGPDIPAELIAAQERGEVVFICGAGASMLAGLPSFAKLVKDIYADLNERWEDHPAESEAVNQGAYDRALRCLERRFGGPDPKSVLTIRRRVREAVRNSLRPTATTFPAHLNILCLSRDAEMRHRVVTTNFDPLFEKAWNQGHPGGERIPSHAGASMPGPQSAGFTGVLHLHGRLADQAEGLDETDLILTSAEFGEAYLRSGWAARYIYDLVRALVVVIVGYSADDPPMRYLLEVIDADRERFRDLRKVFAFVPATPDDASRQEALWDAKGAIPIPYITPEASDHSALYDSLEEWAAYAEDPTTWRKAALQTCFAAAPEKASSDELLAIEWLLGGGDAADILSAIGPSPSWLPKLAELKILKSDGRPHIPWIVGNLGNMEMLEACLGLGGMINSEQSTHIDLALDREYATLHPVIRTAWRLVSRTAKKPRARNYSELGRLMHARTQMKAGDVNYDVVRAICSFLRPRLSVTTPFRMVERAVGIPPSNLGEVMRVEFESPVSETGPNELITLLAEIPSDPDLELKIIGQLGRELVDALEEAADATFARSDYDQASHQIPSVAPHEQNQHGRGFYFLVRAVADLWTRLARAAPDRAARVTPWFLDQSHILPQRIGLEFLTDGTVHSGSEACAALTALPDEMFWRHAKREVMRLTATRWGDMPSAARSDLEARLRNGPPMSLYPGVQGDDRNFADLRDWAVLTRLNRIVQAGGELSEQGQEIQAQFLARFPEFEGRKDDRDDFDVWIGSLRSTGPRGNVNIVREIPLDQLVPTALRIESERQWEQGDLWSNLCREEPERAIAAIAEAPEEHRWAMNAWQPLLDIFSMTQNPEIAPKILALLTDSPPGFVSEAADFIARWMERQREILAEVPDQLQAALALWDRLAETVYLDVVDDEQKAKASRDPMSRAVSDPGGVLAEFLVRLVANQKRARDSGWPEEIKPRVTRAAQCIGPNGLLARVVFAMRLAFLDHMDHEWVAQFMAPWFDWTNEEARPLWRARAYDNHSGLPRLFNRLKDGLLQALRRPDIEYSDASNLSAFTLNAYLHREGPGGENYEIDSLEIRRMLVDASPDTRHATAWVLWRWMSPQKADNGEAPTPDQIWQNGYDRFFRDVWPREPGLRDESTSQDLVRVVLTLDEKLAEAVGTIIGFIVPFNMFDIGITFGLDDNVEYLKSHPRPILDLLNAAIDSRIHPVPRDLMSKLEIIAAADPAVTELPAYNRLVGEWRRRQARG